MAGNLHALAQSHGSPRRANLATHTLPRPQYESPRHRLSVDESSPHASPRPTKTMLRGRMHLRSQVRPSAQPLVQSHALPSGSEPCAQTPSRQNRVCGQAMNIPQRSPTCVGRGTHCVPLHPSPSAGPTPHPCGSVQGSPTRARRIHTPQLSQTGYPVVQYPSKHCAWAAQVAPSGSVPSAAPGASQSFRRVGSPQAASSIELVHRSTNPIGRSIPGRLARATQSAADSTRQSASLA